MDDGRMFGDELKRYRRAARLTQEDLAERAGYSVHYVSMLERGVRLPQPQTVDLLAEALALDETARQMLHATVPTAPSRQIARSWQAVAPPVIPLVGREREREQVTRMLRSDGVRLLTLTGTGGVGKTALAQSVAAALAPDFTDGLALSDFSVISAPEDIVPTIARGLGLREMRGQTIRDRLVGFLRERHILLLLDSFERVVDGAERVGDLLTACPRVAFLVTSRSPLRLRAEHEVRVQPLALPEATSILSPDDLARAPAVALFVQQAKLVNPEFAVNAANADVVADIALRLDGLPLAIELAAARLAHIPLTTLRDRLQCRLHILTGGTRDLPARQQQMRNTIAWSYDLLPPAEQALLRRLAVFAGTWTLDAAEDVCGLDEGADGVLDGLRQLVASSLIIPLDVVPAEARYHMLDTIREYGTEQLAAAGERETLQRRHAMYYARMAEQAEPALQDRNQASWYPRLEREHDNLRAALDWLLRSNEVELALRLVGAVWRFWHRHGDIREGSRWLEDALSRESNGAKQVRAKALWGASWLAYHLGDYARGSVLSAEQLALARELDDALSIRNALTGMGIAALAEGRDDDALLALQEALDVCVPLGDTWHRATSCLNLGAAALVMGDLARAAALFGEAARLYQERGDEVFAARARQHQGYVLLQRGDFMGADSVFVESLQALANLGEKAGIADGLEAVAAARSARGRGSEAAILMGAAGALREQIGVAPLPHIRRVWQPYVSSAEASLDDKHRLGARMNGARLSYLEAVARAVIGARRQ